MVPLYSTKAEETTQAIKAIFSDLEYLPETVVCDSGPEFKNNLFISMMKRLRVKLIFSQSQFKASHVGETFLELIINYNFYYRKSAIYVGTSHLFAHNCF